MKKIIISLLFGSIMIIQAAGFQQLSSISSLSNVSNSVPSNLKSKKTYKDLINALKVAPSGEYQFYLATIYLNGINTPDSTGATVKKDTEKSLFYFKKAIDLGYYNAAQILGSLYVYHKDLISKPNNIEKAIKYLKLAIKNGLYDGTTVLADIYFNYKNNKQEGLKYLELGAEHNIPTAQLMLAILYNWGTNDGKGFVVKKDPYTAQMLLTKACTNKNTTENVKKFCNSSSVKKNKIK